jgi:hypothetical protein
MLTSLQGAKNVFKPLLFSKFVPHYYILANFEPGNSRKINLAGILSLGFSSALSSCSR